MSSNYSFNSKRRDAILASAIYSIASSTHIMLALGFNVDEEATALIKKLEKLVDISSYDALNLDELLQIAREIGD